MHPGRNDPCHCGSGRKYKRCCASRDEREESARRPLRLPPLVAEEAIRKGIRLDEPWQVELVPMTHPIADDPAARPAAVLIVANGLVLHADLLSHPPAEPEEIGRLLAENVVATVEHLGQAPPRIDARYEKVAAALRERLAPLKIEVRCERKLPALHELSSGLRQRLLQLDTPIPPLSMPHTWAGWDLPTTVMEDIFDAAASYYRAQPWSVFGDEEALAIELHGGVTWYAIVLGAAGLEFGLGLYENLEDHTRVLEGGAPHAAFNQMESMVLSLSFDAREKLPKPMRRELAAAKWHVAGPRAYPSLWTMNTPGGGFTLSQASELAVALRAVAGYATEMERSHSQSTEPLDEWRDEASGAVVRYLGSFALDHPPLWEAPATLTASLPQGRGAKPRALIDPDSHTSEAEEAERAVLDRFSVWLRESGAPESRARRDVENADAILRCLAGFQGIGVAAITEYDLRVVLYDQYIRKVRDSRTAAMAMRGSLRRFFTFLAEHEEIDCPWAEPVLRDKIAFEARLDSFPGGFWWDEEVKAWQRELYQDLHARVMIPGPMLADDGRRHETMGVEEHRLWTELQREWLIWRDELIRGGVTDPAQLRDELIVRQQAWERKPLPRLNNRTVGEVIEHEREQRAEVELPPPFR